MKLNLLILSLIGVSVSASGIRGFVPIKGSDRRLATSKSSRSSKSASGEAVAKLVKSMSRTWCPKSLDLDDTLSKSTSSKSKSKSRRLDSTSKSKSSSTSTDDSDFLYISREGGDCIYRLYTGSSKPTSKSSSKSKGS